MPGSSLHAVLCSAREETQKRHHSPAPRVAPPLAAGLPDPEEEEMQNEPNVILGILTLTPFFLRASLVPSCPSWRFHSDAAQCSAMQRFTPCESEDTKRTQLPKRQLRWTVISSPRSRRVLAASPMPVRRATRTWRLCEAELTCGALQRNAAFCSAMQRCAASGRCYSKRTQLPIRQ
jgi:hypothetical protein